MQDENHVVAEPVAQNNNNHNHSKRTAMLELAGAIFLAIAILYFFYWILFGRFEEYTDDAYVAGNVVELMPLISGTVVSIATDDTYLVTRGQPLVMLSHNDALITYEKAMANLAATVRQTAELYQNAASAKATLALRQSELVKAKDDLQRREGLVASEAVSGEEYQHATAAVQVSQAQVDVAQHQLDTAITLVNNTSLYHYPAVETAKADFRAAFLNLERTTLFAPVTGYIAKRSVQLGEQVNPGDALMAIVPLNEIWIDANFKESQLENLRIGQSVTLYSDIYGNDVKYRGIVLGLGAGTGSAFQLLPAENATGNWIKIVQRVPVRVAIDPQQLAQYPLRIGLSMRVTVNTRDRRGYVLATVPRAGVIYQTSVYQQETAPAEAIINKIVAENAPNVAINDLPNFNSHS